MYIAKQLTAVEIGENTMATKTERIFYPGEYYLVDTENNIIIGDKDINICKQMAQTGDMILVCLPANYERKSKTEAPAKPTKAEKIIVNFTKKLLTIVGGSVKLDGVDYSEGDFEVNFDKWVELVKDCNSKANTVEFVGTPPINGKDITNEMSDL